MTNYDITITFFTIIYGLMVTDLFLSFHKLITSRKKIKWHWLPLLAAWYLFLIILYNWWDLLSLQGNTEWLNLQFFIAYGHLLLLIYLAVSTVLPDAPTENEIDLKEYYFKNHRYFWGLMTSVVLLSIIIGFFNGIDNSSQASLYNMLFYAVIIVSLFVLLTITKKFWVHSILLIVFCLQTIVEIVMK